MEQKRRAGPEERSVGNVRERVLLATHLGNYQIKQPSCCIFNGSCADLNHASSLSCGLQTEDVHYRAQANEPARAEEERSGVGVRWKFVAGHSGH